MDVVSYNTLIKAYVRHNLFDQAVSLLLTMRLLLSFPTLPKFGTFGSVERPVARAVSKILGKMC